MLSGQNLLVIGALAILTLLILTFYGGESAKDSLTIDNEAMIAATGLGQILIEEMSALSFDEKVINDVVDVPDSLTSASDLGPESGETTIELFDDMDDYNNYSRTDSLFRLGNFTIDIVVTYVQNEEPDKTTNSRTFYKLATVSVSNRYLLTTLKLHHLASY